MIQVDPTKMSNSKLFFFLELQFTISHPMFGQRTWLSQLGSRGACSTMSHRWIGSWMMMNKGSLLLMKWDMLCQSTTNKQSITYKNNKNKQQQNLYFEYYQKFHFHLDLVKIIFFYLNLIQQNNSKTKSLKWKFHSYSLNKKNLN